MIFNSLTYAVFLAIVVPLYWVLPYRARLWLIFLSSLTFYGFWRWEYTFLMMVPMAIDYFAALQMSAAENDPRARKMWLALSLTANIGLLAYFKYLGFVVGNAVGLLDLVGFDITPPDLGILLPLGISFYTFQTMSYTIDVYRRVAPAEKDFLVYGCFVTLFPELVAGPIVRSVETIPQLLHRPAFRWTDLSEGSKQIIVGLLLKTVCADNLSGTVDEAYAQPVDQLSAYDVWTLAFLFGFQIYFDFAAYSRIAIGSARLLGIHYPENFNFPYAATSPRDFWKRWHITLSSWIRDYLYLPLTGATFHTKTANPHEAMPEDVPASQRRRDLALLTTWAIMGLWHGAAWTFVFWGVYHACMVLAHRILLNSKEPPKDSLLKRFGAWAITLPLMMLGWIPFRATSLWDSLRMMIRVLDPRAYMHLGALRENTYIVAALCLLVTVLAYFSYMQIIPRLEKRPGLRVVVETGVFTVAVGLVIIFLRPVSQFIYFQF